MAAENASLSSRHALSSRGRSLAIRADVPGLACDCFALRARWGGIIERREGRIDLLVVLSSSIPLGGSLVWVPACKRFHGLIVVVTYPFLSFFGILVAAGLLAHRLHLAARTTRQHGGRWRRRWHVLVAAHAAEPAFETARSFFAPFSPSPTPLLPFFFK